MCAVCVRYACAIYALYVCATRVLCMRCGCVMYAQCTRYVCDMFALCARFECAMYMLRMVVVCGHGLQSNLAKNREICETQTLENEIQENIVEIIVMQPIEK